MAQSQVKIESSLLEEISNNLDVEGIFLKAGVLGNGVDTGVKGSNSSAEKVNPAEYAYKHEFGIGVPQRAFLRPTLRKNEDDWKELFAHQLQIRNYDVAAALSDMIDVVSGSIIEEIRNGNFKPLSPRTLEFKKAQGYPEWDKPLIATGTMISSISAEVVGK